MGGVLMALMPVVLGMLANRDSQRGGAAQWNDASDAGGGLGGILGQVLGGAAGRGGGAGGLGGLLEQLQRTGYADEANSWGALLPEVVDRITPDGGVPDVDALTNSVDDLVRRFGQRG